MEIKKLFYGGATRNGHTYMKKILEFNSRCQEELARLTAVKSKEQELNDAFERGEQTGRAKARNDDDLTAVYLKGVEEGKQAGRLERERELLEGAISAWALIGPTSKDITAVSLARGRLEDDMTGLRYSNFNKHEEYVVKQEAIRNDMLNQGWQIVPVKVLKMEALK